MVSSQDCEHQHSWVYVFPSNHLCWCSFCSNNLSSSVRAFHSSNIQPNPCSCPCSCPCPVRAVLTVLACLCLCPCLCQMRQCPWDRLLLGVMNLPVSRFVHLRDLYTHSMFWFLLSRHHTKSISHDSTVRVSRDHPATKLQGNSCECLPQECVCVSSGISSATVASHEIFHLLDGAHQYRISLKRLRARPAVYGFHLPCNLHQLSKPWSPPVDVTTSKLSPP